MVEIIRLSPIYESPSELQPKIAPSGKRESTGIRAARMVQPTATERLHPWDEIDLDANETEGRELWVLGGMDNKNTNQPASPTPRILEVLRNPGSGTGSQAHTLDTESLGHVFARRKVNGVWNPSQNSDMSVHLEMGVKLDLQGAFEEFCRLYRVGNFVGAETFFADNLEDHLDRPDVLISYAEMLLQQGDYLGIRELDDSVIRNLTGRSLKSMEARLLSTYWELIVIFAKSYEPCQLEVQAMRTFKAAKDLHDVIRSPDRDISSTEIKLLSLLVRIDRRPHKSLYGLASHAVEQFFAPELLTPIYRGLLRQGRIWDMHDLTEAIVEQGYLPHFLHDLFDQNDVQLGLQQLVSEWEHPNSDDASTALALLDTLMFLIFDGLSPSYIAHGKGILDMATSLARSIAQKHPGLMKSRAYTRWLLARSYCYGNDQDVQISRSFIQHLVDSEGVFWMPPRRALPQYVPLKGESPGWEQPDAAPEALQAIQLVLNTARELGDYKTEVLALKRLIQLSRNPGLHFEDLCEVQKLDQGDMDGYIETLLSKYLVVSPGASQAQLKMDLEEQIFAPGFADSFSTDRIWLAFMLFSSLAGKGPRAEEAARIADEHYELLDQGLCDLLDHKMPELRKRAYNRRALVQYTNPAEALHHPLGNKSSDREASPPEMPNTERNNNNNNSDWVHDRFIEEDSEEENLIRSYSAASGLDEVAASLSPEVVEATESRPHFRDEHDPVHRQQISHDDYSSYPMLGEDDSDYTPMNLNRHASGSKHHRQFREPYIEEFSSDPPRLEPSRRPSNRAIYESREIQPDSMSGNDDGLRVRLRVQDHWRPSQTPFNEGDHAKDKDESNVPFMDRTEKAPAELESTQFGLGLPESLKPGKNGQGKEPERSEASGGDQTGVDSAFKKFHQRNNPELSVIRENTDPVVEKALSMDRITRVDPAAGEIPENGTITMGDPRIKETNDRSANMESPRMNTVNVPDAEEVGREETRMRTASPPKRALRQRTNSFEPSGINSQEPIVGIKKIVSFGDHKLNTNTPRSREYEDIDYSSIPRRPRSWHFGQASATMLSRHHDRPRSSHSDYPGLAASPMFSPVIINNRIHSRSNSARSPVRKSTGRSSLSSEIKRSASRRSHSQRRPPDEASRTVTSTSLASAVSNRTRTRRDQSPRPIVPSRSGSRSKGRWSETRDRDKDAGLWNGTTLEEVVVREMAPVTRRSASFVDRKGKRKEAAVLADVGPNAGVGEHRRDDDKHSTKSSRPRREPEGDGRSAQNGSVDPTRSRSRVVTVESVEDLSEKSREAEGSKPRDNWLELAGEIV